jgi:hypothetical protein
MSTRLIKWCTSRGMGRDIIIWWVCSAALVFQADSYFRPRALMVSNALLDVIHLC